LLICCDGVRIDQLIVSTFAAGSLPPAFLRRSTWIGQASAAVRGFFGNLWGAAELPDSSDVIPTYEYESQIFQKILLQLHSAELVWETVRTLLSEYGTLAVL